MFKIKIANLQTSKYIINMSAFSIDLPLTNHKFLGLWHFVLACTRLQISELNIQSHVYGHKEIKISSSKILQINFQIYEAYKS